MTGSKRAWWRPWFRPHVREDDVFGRIVFDECGEQSFWTGKVRLDDVGESGEYVEVFIDGGSAGPGPEQKALFSKITAKFRDLRPLVGRLLRDSYQRAVDPGFDGALWSIFRLSGIHIPAVESQDMQWAFAFKCLGSKGRGFEFMVMMKGWEPTGEVRIED